MPPLRQMLADTPPLAADADAIRFSRGARCRSTIVLRYSALETRATRAMLRCRGARRQIICH